MVAALTRLHYEPWTGEQSNRSSERSDMDSMDDTLKNIVDVPYGGESLGIGEKYPVAVFGAPPNGEYVGSATWTQLRDAGFDRPGDDPTLVDENGEQHDLLFFVLNIDGEIVATWDEGRWWTPQESDAFVATLHSPVLRHLAEMTAMNREQRRKR